MGTSGILEVAVACELDFLVIFVSANKDAKMASNPFEVIANLDEEIRQIKEIERLMVELLKKRYADSGRFLRGVHPKSHGCFNAEFQVLEDIEEELRVGLFAEPGARFNAIVRYSNADSLVRPDLRDGENGSRGMALKILNVPGEKVFGADEDSQDFLMINTAEFAFADIAAYLRLQQVLLEFNDKPEPFFDFKDLDPANPADLIVLKQIKQSGAVLAKIKQTPVANPLEVAYFGAAPFLFGNDRAMRVSVVPIVAPEQVVAEDPDENYLRNAIATTMENNEDVVFDFKIQVRQAGEDNLFIEDATKSWSFDEFPGKTVARLTIPAPQQDDKSCEKQFFTPWHSLADHQPLGGINRLRKAVYIASAKRRQAGVKQDGKC